MMRARKVIEQRHRCSACGSPYRDSMSDLQYADAESCNSDRQPNRDSHPNIFSAFFVTYTLSIDAGRAKPRRLNSSTNAGARRCNTVGASGMSASQSSIKNSVAPEVLKAANCVSSCDNAIKNVQVKTRLQLRVHPCNDVSDIAPLTATAQEMNAKTEAR